MKFRTLRKTPNGFVIGKWYKDNRPGLPYRNWKWQVVDHKKILHGPLNNWFNDTIEKHSKHLFCYCSDTAFWDKGIVIRVGIETLEK